MTTFNEAKDRIINLLNGNNIIERYINQPKLRCEDASQDVTALLRQNQIDFEVRGILTWENAENGAGGNHYVVIAVIDGQRVVIDLTAGQFTASQGGPAIIDSVQNWEEQFSTLPRLRRSVLKFQDFPTHSQAKSALDPTNPPLLTDPAWTLLGTAPNWAKDHLDYPRWGTKYAEYQASIASTTPPSLRLTEAQKVVKLTELARLFVQEVQPFKVVQEEIRNNERSIPTELSNRQQLIAQAGAPDGPSYSHILDELDRYHADANDLSVTEKRGRLSDLALLMDDYAANHRYNLNDRATKLLVFAKNVRAYAIGLRLRENALGSLDESQGWRQPSLSYLSELASNHIEPPDGNRPFRSQVILQMQGDDNSFNAAMSLFQKYPKNTEWVQLRPGEGIRNVQSNAPLQLNDDGQIKIILIGHGTTQDGQTLFGGKTIDEVKAHLTVLLEQASQDKIKGIQLSLVGCELGDTPFPEQLGTWLLDTANNMGISHDNLSLSAYRYPVQVTADGKKEILTPEWGWINKEEARLKDVVHKVELVWDAKAGALVRKPLSLGVLMEVGTEIESVIHHPGLSETDRTELVNLHQTVGDQVRKHVLDVDAPNAAHRQVITEYALKNIRSMNLATQWTTLMQTLMQQQQMSSQEWLPTLQINTNQEDGKTKILFLRRNPTNTESSRWVETNNDSLLQVHAQYNELLNDVSQGLVWQETEQQLRPRSDLSEANAGYTLNAAFMLQTLIAMRSENGQPTAMSDALKIETYTRFVQNGAQIIGDGARISQLVNSALSTDLNLLSKAATIIDKLGTVANPVFDAIAIGAIMAELQQTSDPAARTAIETKLGLSIVSSGMNIAALGANLAGLSTATATFGALATPITGLAIGVPYLVENYARLRQGFDQASTYMDALMATVSQPGLRQDNHVWQFQSGAVVREIDFKNGSTQYGQVVINGTTGGSWHTVTGGWDHYLARPDPSSRQVLNIYTGFGVAKNQSFDASQVGNTPVLLPSGVDRYLTMDYGQLTGRRAANAPALRRLHDYYGDQFIWGMYAFPTDWGITELKVTLEHTPIHIVLDAAPRTVIIPTVADADQRQHLSYGMAGDGGTYIVVMPALPVEVEIEHSANANNNTWIFDVDYVVKQHTIVDGKIVLGELKENVFAGIQVEDNAITIGGQKVEFLGHNVQETVQLVSTINENITLLLTRTMGWEKLGWSSSGTEELVIKTPPSAQDMTLLQNYFSNPTIAPFAHNNHIAALIDLGGANGKKAGVLDILSGEFIYAGGSTTFVREETAASITHLSSMITISPMIPMHSNNDTLDSNAFTNKVVHAEKLIEAINTITPATNGALSTFVPITQTTGMPTLTTPS